MTAKQSHELQLSDFELICMHGLVILQSINKIISFYSLPKHLPASFFVSMRSQYSCSVLLSWGIKNIQDTHFVGVKEVFWGSFCNGRIDYLFLAGKGGCIEIARVRDILNDYKCIYLYLYLSKIVFQLHQKCQKN